MRDNTKDKTIERNYIQKWRFLVREYQLVKEGKHPYFRFVQDFYSHHGTSRQTFAKYYNRHRQRGDDETLLPRKRGPRWKSRRTLPYIEQKVLELRRKGINRYEIYAILQPTLKSHTPSPSTISPSVVATTEPADQTDAALEAKDHQDPCWGVGAPGLPPPEQGPGGGEQESLLPGVGAGRLHPSGVG